MPQAKVWNVDGPEVLTRFMKTSNFDQAKKIAGLQAPPPPVPLRVYKPRTRRLSGYLRPCKHLPTARCKRAAHQLIELQRSGTTL